MTTSVSTLSPKTKGPCCAARLKFSFSLSNLNPLGGRFGCFFFFCSGRGRGGRLSRRRPGRRFFIENRGRGGGFRGGGAGGGGAPGECLWGGGGGIQKTYTYTEVWGNKLFLEFSFLHLHS